MGLRVERQVCKIQKLRQNRQQTIGSEPMIMSIWPYRINQIKAFEKVRQSEKIIAR